MQTFSLNNRLGNILKELRDKKQWTLRQASEKVGYSAAYISMLERGVHSTTGKAIKVTPEALEIFAEVYDYPYNLLMLAAGYGEYSDSLDEVAATNDYMIHEDPSPYYTEEDYLSSLQNDRDIRIEQISFPRTIETIGDRLKLLRERNNYTQKDLVNELTLFSQRDDDFYTMRTFTLDEIKMIETGELNPDSDFLISASQLFDVSAHWILTGQEFKSKKIKNLSDATASLETILEMLDKIKKESANLTQEIRDSLPSEVKLNDNRN